ncbi:MAG: PAS domain-containing sensor histidine kinase [Actinomycetota bacterium]|nr:PAS domain-containing sensor histidine kinase [Actinomycetota bacterium]MDD5666892.1 PAS domain-containing sensor histidine kinase [Actinomycetota bacterium]
MEKDDGTGERLDEEVEGLRRRVSELEQAEKEMLRVRKALEQGMEALNIVLENSHDILAILGKDGIISYISPSVERITGYNRDRLIGTNALETIHPEDMERFLVAFTAGMVKPGKAINMEARYRHVDGTWHFMEAQGINLTDNPVVGGMVVTARDITDRKAVEEELKRSESYYRSLIRNAADMISILDSDLKFRWGSRSSAKVTGYTAETIYGRSFLEFIHPDEYGRVREALDHVVRNPGVPKYIECFFRHADGSYHFHSIVLTSLLEDPSVLGIIINSRDISERRLMEEELLATNRELDSFASTVAHDLRTPLALIEGYAQLMRAEGNTREENEAYLKSIIAAARRMDGLTESLLEYAQAGQAAGAAVTVEPLDVLSDILFEHSGEIEDRGIEVVLGESFPAIKVDHFKLRQVFTNLVNNAVKYLAGVTAPRIEVSSREDGDTAVFCVRDNGPGLDPEFKDEVFLPFKRFGSKSSPGLGIGLSTVKRAVEGWGGRVWVESEPGKGAAFFFTAPLASA